MENPVSFPASGIDKMRKNLR